MEAIKNLRESSVLLSNAGFVSYSSFAKAIIYHPCLDSVEDGDIDVSIFENIKMVVENCARYTYIDLLVALDKWAVEDEYRVIFDAMMSYRNGTNDEFFHSEYRDGEPSNNAPEEEHTCELSTTMFNLNDDRSEEEKEDDILFEAKMDDAFSNPEKKEERVLTPEEEEDAYDAWYEAEFGNCPCLVIPEEKVILGTTYKSVAEAIYNFGDAQILVGKKPSNDLDIEFVKEVVLGMASVGPASFVDELIKEATHWDYRGIYRELYILIGNDIADIDEDIYLHDGVPYSIEMCDGHRVVCPHFEQIIEADEVKEAAFFDDDFEDILDEETGKIEWCRVGRERLTAEDYEEMERLEADDSYDPIAEKNHYPTDDLPF